MRALDLYCGAGGASKGLHNAGFHMFGVDKQDQPRYPYGFKRCDALSLPLSALRMFDFIWASPPCQKHTALKTMHNAKQHEDLIPQTRAMLQAAGVPYVIENVMGAPLINPLLLCGTMFDLGVEDAELRRHRQFECSFPIPQPGCQHNKLRTIGIYGGHVRNRQRRAGSNNRGVADFSVEQGQEAMGIDWMTLAELSQAIPPPYSEFIGRAALNHIHSAAVPAAVAGAQPAAGTVCPTVPAPIDGIPRESGLVRLARPPALNEDGTTVGPQVAARTGFSSPDASPVTPTASGDAKLAAGVV
jgi:DNA (cytosine-5)-methyltransferase 1